MTQWGHCNYDGIAERMVLILSLLASFYRYSVIPAKGGITRNAWIWRKRYSKKQGQATGTATFANKKSDKP